MSRPCVGCGRAAASHEPSCFFFRGAPAPARPVVAPPAPPPTRISASEEDAAALELWDMAHDQIPLGSHLSEPSWLADTECPCCGSLGACVRAIARGLRGAE